MSFNKQTPTMIGHDIATATSDNSTVETSHFLRGKTASGSSMETVVVSPFYLHPVDHLGMVISMIEFTKENYESWAKTMRNVLISKRKEEFIDGMATPPLWSTLIGGRPVQ